MLLTTTLPKIKPTTFRSYTDMSSCLSSSQVSNALATRTMKLIDARIKERFHGKIEPIDPIAGHIPKALNRAFQLNLDEQGLFLSKKELYQQFIILLGKTGPEQTIHMCGSGVTACHNLLAMEHAGLAGSKLYAGSWSEWIKNPNNAISSV